MACTPDAVETHAPLADASDLLAIVAAHLEAGHLALSRGPEPVGRLIEEALRVLQPLAAERGQSLVGQAGEELPPVDVDRERVLQVLLNLVGNALKFSPEQGVVRVTAARQGQQVRVSVRDSGSGIAPEDLPHLFERFWQAKDWGCSSPRASSRPTAGSSGSRASPGQGPSSTSPSPLPLRLRREEGWGRSARRPPVPRAAG